MFNLILVSRLVEGRCHGNQFFMVALWNRADHYIFARWFLSSIFFSFLA